MKSKIKESEIKLKKRQVVRNAVAHWCSASP